MERVARAERVDDVNAESRELAQLAAFEPTAHRCARRSRRETMRCVWRDQSARGRDCRYRRSRANLQPKIRRAVRCCSESSCRDAARPHRARRHVASARCCQTPRVRTAGKRLSCEIASASATSASASSGLVCAQAVVAEVRDDPLALLVDGDSRDRSRNAWTRRACRTVDLFLRRQVLKKVSPTVSTPGGPPSGPAKLACAPR